MREGVHGMRTGAASLALVLLFAACAGGPVGSQPAQATDQAADQSTTGAPTLAPAFTPGASVLLPPTLDPDATPDPAEVSELTALGLSEGQAIFLALTTTAVQQMGPLSYEIAHAFPTGNTAQLSVEVVPNQVFDPESSEAVTFTETAPFTTTDTDEVVSFTLQYFIAYEDMPDDVEQQLRNPAAGIDLPALAALAYLAPAPRPVAADTDGVMVIVQGLIDAQRDTQVSEFLGTLDKALGNKASLDDMFGALQSGLAVKDALSLRAELEPLLTELDALEKCARNPTNPITKNGYRDDPTQKQRILDAIAEARSAIKANGVVMFIGMLNATGSSLIKGVPALGFIVGPLTSWSKESLSEINTRRLEEIRRLVTPCDQEWDFTMTLGYGAGAERLEVTWIGNFTVAAPVPGRVASPITGAGQVTGEVHLSTCTQPTDISGNSVVLKGDFAQAGEGDFAITGEAVEGIASGERSVFLELTPKLVESSAEFPEPSVGCLEMAFIGVGLLVGSMTDPNAMVRAPIRIQAKDKETLTEPLAAKLDFGDDSVTFEMTRTVTIKLRR